MQDEGITGDRAERPGVAGPVVLILLPLGSYLPMTHCFRIVTYNLREGLRPLGGGRADQRRLARGRVHAAQRLIAKLAADILVLNEALFSVEFEGTLIDYAKLFSYPHQTAALYDREWGNAILSRFPILDVKEMRIHNRGGLLTAIAVGGSPLTVATYHPHPGRRPRNKAADFAALIEGIEGPRLVCGDFNCVNPEDEIDRARLVSGFARFSAEPEEAVLRYLDSGRAVFALLEASGLRDAIPPTGRGYTVPTDLLSREKDSAMRLDHILVSAEIEVRAGLVLHTPLTERISDHYPVVADLAIRSPPHAGKSTRLNHSAQRTEFSNRR